MVLSKKQSLFIRSKTFERGGLSSFHGTDWMSQWRSPEMYRLEKALRFVSKNKTYLVLHWVDELRIAWFNVPVKHNLLKMKGNIEIKSSTLKERMVLKRKYLLTSIAFPWQIFEESSHCQIIYKHCSFFANVYSVHNVNVKIVFIFFYLSRSGNSLVRVGLASYYKLTEFLMIGRYWGEPFNQLQLSPQW